MVKVSLVERKSNALTPSSLRCLSRMPTVNMTAGCIHGCAYCYIRGYSQYPGDDAVTVYRNTAEQVERELKRKRKRPIAVYFCPSSDAFMPVEEVLDQSYCTMKLLLDQGVGVQFVTKGVIPERFFDLFAKRPELVAGQVGLTTLDDRLNEAIEPGAASAKCRLNDLGHLIDIGVTTSMRADPLIHGVTDNDDDLAALFTEAAARSVRDVTVSYLFLRPAIVGSLRRTIHDESLLGKVLAPYSEARRTGFKTLGSISGGSTLPLELRQAQLNRVRRLAERCGLAPRICGCKNGEITSAKCHLTNLTVTARAIKQTRPGPSLW